MLKIIGLQAVDYSNLKTKHSVLSYGKRIGFVDPNHKARLKTNPRDELGKMGIRYHGILTSLFYTTLAVQVDCVPQAGIGQTRIVHLNKSSTIQWLNSQLPPDQHLNEQVKNETLVKKINALSRRIAKQEEETAERIEDDLIDGIDFQASYPPKFNQRPLISLFDRIKALFWRCFYRISISSWTFFRLRFALNLKEKTLKDASERLATAAYHQALKVPAYQSFIARKGLTGQTFADLPFTSKENYIKPALEKGEEVSLYLDGQIPTKSKRDTSTGTSGKSTPWYRGKEEQRVVETLTSYAAKVVIGDGPYTFINGFAVGPWATGITATLAMNSDANAGVCVIGPNISEIYECIKEQMRIRPAGHPIVVGGYPPHIRAVVDLAVAEGFALHRQNIFGIVGGEAMSEDLRDLLIVQKDKDGGIVRTGFQQCFSSIGASDLDINIGYESAFEIELRAICHHSENRELAEELFGKNEFKPMIFHYDPLNYHIEVDREQNLIFTCVRGDRISPRIRYNLGDRGKIMPLSDVLATLAKHGIQLKNKPTTHLPLLFVWGRQGSHLSFRGCKVAPENLSEAIRRLDEGQRPGINEKIAHYGFYQYDQHGRKTTEILLEFNETTDYNEADDTLLADLITQLAEVNSDFVAQIQACPDNEKPILRVFKKGKSPMDTQQKKYPMRKQQYIFQEGDEFISTHATIAVQGKILYPRLIV